MEQLPELTRQRLAWDAECVSAAAALWQIYNTGEMCVSFQPGIDFILSYFLFIVPVAETIRACFTGPLKATCTSMAKTSGMMLFDLFSATR